MPAMETMYISSIIKKKFQVNYTRDLNDEKVRMQTI